MASKQPPSGSGAGLTIERFRVPEGLLLKLGGLVDEQFPMGVFHDARGVVVVDMSGIRRVTSFGIREWIQQIGRVQCSHLYFVNVPSYVMAQFGMVAGFGGPRGQILSYFAPYICGKCGRERDRLFDRRTDSDVDCVETPPKMACKDCEGQMEFDDVPEFYREALAGTAPLEIVPALFRVLGSSDAAARPLKVSKAIEGSATVLWLSGALDERATFRRAADGLEGDVVVVADQVTACTDAGVTALGRLITAASEGGCRVWLARCAAPLVDALARQPDAVRPAKVVSLEIDATCPACSRAGTYVSTMHSGSGPMAGAADAIDKGIYCPRCGTACVTDAPPVLLDRIRMLPTGETPDWMLPMIERRPMGTPASFRELFADKYSLVKLLGAGGMAEIYLARQLGPAGFDRKVAIKRILPNLAREATFIQMFLGEARLAARLSHPNIVQIHELQENEGQYYIVMEFVDGFNLSSLLTAMKASGKHMPAGVACRIMADVCAALEAAHSARDDRGNPLKIVHRDVSPHNVLVARDGAVKLSDFGVARAENHLEPTKPGILKGKISYLSPEALSGNDPDHRTDIFAAGIVLFQCLAGFHPFWRNSEYQTFQAILNDPLPPVLATRPELPPEVEGVLAKATARKVEDRYQSAEDMLLDLEKLIAKLGKPSTAKHVAAWVASVDMTPRDGEPTEAPTAAARGAPEKN